MQESMASLAHVSALVALTVFISCTAAQRCQPVKVPMCRGLVGYSHTRMRGGATQAQAALEMDSLWPFVDMGCSANLRLTACATYLPKCPAGNARGAGWPPCRETCQAARRCRRVMTQMRFPWPSNFKCFRLRPKSAGRCVPPVPEAGKCNRNHVTCTRNTLPFCSNLPFTHGASPNMFLQCNATELRVEMQQYRPLVRSACHAGLKFFLCGVFRPFCVRANVPFALPCRELCESIQAACEGSYRRLYRGLPWPSKFQCHRYPAMGDENFRCVMPSDSPSVLTEARATPGGSRGGRRPPTSDRGSSNRRNRGRRPTTA